MSNRLLPNKTLKEVLQELVDLEQDYQEIKTIRQELKVQVQELLIVEGYTDYLSVNWNKMEKLLSNL